MEKSKRKSVKYDKSYPSRLYHFFVTYQETSSAPSICKFARESGLTHADLLQFKEKNKEFRRACEECSEIRRDYLIDQALTKRFDPSFVKYLLGEENTAPDDKDSGDMHLTLEVVHS